MTFVLKEFSELTKEFRDLVVVEIDSKKNDKIKSITDLHEPRKSELQFLTALITDLEKQIKDKKIHNTKPHALALYAAMRVVCQDIDNNLTMLQSNENSQVYTSLKDSMFRNKETNKHEEPDANQVQAMYEELIRFLRLSIYKEGDSRKGLEEKHAFSEIPSQRLETLIYLSYKLSQDANNNALAVLKTTGASIVDTDTYRVEQPVSREVVLAQFKSWQELQDSLDNLIKAQRADKNVSNVSKLPSASRAAQLSFLIEIERSLKDASMTRPEKVAILAGAMHIVRGQINADYGRNPLDIRPIKKSLVQQKLTEILKVNTESPENIEAMINATYRYLKFCTVERASGDVKTDSFRAKHILSNTTWDLMKGFKLINEMIYNCREVALKICLSKSKTQESSAVKGGFFSSLLYSSKEPVTAESTISAAAATTSATSAAAATPLPGAGH